MHPDGVYSDFSIKARCKSIEQIEEKLRSLNAVFEGEDLQTDTYYQASVGRLKVRKGTIENLVTHYVREADGDKMKTTVFVYERDPKKSIIRKYTQSRKVIGKVIKHRRIYWIDNVKFHLDKFDDGSTFVEIEAMDRDGSRGHEAIKRQAEEYKMLLSIRDEDIITGSYLDMQ